MTAARRTLLEDVEAWALTLPRPVPRPTLVPAPAPDWTEGAELPGPAGGLPSLTTIRVGRAVHLVPTHADHALCGTPTTGGPWTPAPGRRPTCPGCALPPEA